MELQRYLGESVMDMAQPLFISLILEATPQMFLCLGSEHGHIHFHGFPTKVHVPIF